MAALLYSTFKGKCLSENVIKHPGKDRQTQINLISWQRSVNYTEQAGVISE